MLRGLQQEDSVIRLEYWGTGTMTIQGQPSKLTSYKASINYSTPGMRVDFLGAASDGRATQAGSRRCRALRLERDPAEGEPHPRARRRQRAAPPALEHPTGCREGCGAAGADAKVTVEAGATVLSFPLPAPLPSATMKVTLMPANVTMATATASDRRSDFARRGAGWHRRLRNHLFGLWRLERSRSQRPT